jgi:FkbM family methyltransferase
MRAYKTIKNILTTILFVFNHPLNSQYRFASVFKYLRWQIGSRVLGLPILIPLLEDVHVFCKPGLTGVTGNIYCGLDEYEFMSLVLHSLREGDLLVDVGANEGTYTLLASGGPGCEVIAFEPIPQIFNRLERNVRLNGLTKLVRLVNIGLGSKAESMCFTSNDDTKDHALVEGEASSNQVTVSIDKLDNILGDCFPTIIKIDVEGFEYEVLSGSENTLNKESLLALIVETNGSGLRYGRDDRMVFDLLSRNGFRPYFYNPKARLFTEATFGGSYSYNTIFIRDLQEISSRVLKGREYRLANGSVL